LSLYNFKENMMQIQINTDHNVQGREALANNYSNIVASALKVVSGHITRVEVHLSDESNNEFGPKDKRCMIEARLEGRQPIAVTHKAASVDDAVVGAAEKLARFVESTLGKDRDKNAHRPDRSVARP